jgi:hypothetical protein
MKTCAQVQQRLWETSKMCVLLSHWSLPYVTLIQLYVKKQQKH